MAALEDLAATTTPVLQFHEVLLLPEHLAIISEFADGGDLADCIDRHKATHSGKALSENTARSALQPCCLKDANGLGGRHSASRSPSEVYTAALICSAVAARQQELGWAGDMLGPLAAKQMRSAPEPCQAKVFALLPR